MVRVVRAIPVVLVLAAIAAGLVVVSLSNWRTGSLVLAGAALLGAVLRAALPPRLAGVLVARSRLLDVAVYLMIAALLAGMALVTVTPHG